LRSQVGASMALKSMAMPLHGGALRPPKAGQLAGGSAWKLKIVNALPIPP
jgi:hypothetical protein